MDRQSWVETTCPPGWQVSRSRLGHQWSPCRAEFGSANISGFAHPHDGDGCIVWVDTEAAARRLAWERWALDVLGPVTWHADWITSPLVVMGRGGLYIAADHEEDEPRWYVEAGPTSGVRLSAASTDPVEALARLAALTLAVLGPEGAQ